ncbi:MAG: hypothetical protein HFH47_02160 [Bacilli bacterium]|jgi:hypothetical protein|nr:hypothetical protein [Bacilli bacterium]
MNKGEEKMKVYELIEILEEYDGEIQVVISDESGQEVLDLAKVEINYRKDDFRLALIAEEY